MSRTCTTEGLDPFNRDRRTDTGRWWTKHHLCNPTGHDVWSHRICIESQSWGLFLTRSSRLLRREETRDALRGQHSGRYLFGGGWTKNAVLSLIQTAPCILPKGLDTPDFFTLRAVDCSTCRHMFGWLNHFLESSTLGRFWDSVQGRLRTPSALQAPTVVREEEQECNLFLLT